MGKKALIVRGGWEGHQPVEVSELFRDILVEEGFEVEISETLDAFLDVEKLKSLYLIIPVWTMGKITDAQVRPVLEAVASGVGIAGCHGGMCDAFRECVQWQFMTGGQWVAHPGGDGVEYVVNVKRGSSPIVEGIEDFTVKSEQYYVHIDPSIEVLATTRFPVVDGPHAANGQVDVPVVWTKRWGRGRVFYCSLGHHVDVLQVEPVRTIMKRGFLWAAEGKDVAMQASDNAEVLIQSVKRMF
ncbi:ThuA domain-containing protein [Caldicoprobacter algeriensis]|uniref:ThuA domain-containing protein n=1 Tax=Caldicoprobacter algeriensis TaxID=699281 RepID=UPI00207AA474|nr:ThuA domain-containing protein [Caldicoprobacter algeriensis]MCM8900961.1 ThuA domain-containing protein [Caldicoprobacter algeriensis]